MTRQPLHTTRSGKEIPISEMSDEHLNATILMLRRRAKEGVTVVYAGYGVDELYDEDARNYLGLDDYEGERYERDLRARRKGK